MGCGNISIIERMRRTGQLNMLYSQLPLFFNHNVKNVQYGMKYHTAYTSTAASHCDSGHKLVFARIFCMASIDVVSTKR